MKDDSFYMNIAYNEARKAYKKNEVPVGAVIVSLKNGNIISKAYNLRDNSCIVTKHAEIIAIEKANKLQKNWRLSDCVLYTTLRPCEMCLSVIKTAKIKLTQIDNSELILKSSTIIQKKFLEIRFKG